MEYRLDNYVSYDMDGFARLLFESKEHYIYIWLDSDLTIQALQVNHNVPEKKAGRLDSRNLIFHFSKKKGASTISNYIKDIFINIDCLFFKNMFSYLASLEIGDLIDYKLDEKETEHFSEMPASKKHSTPRLRDPKIRRKRGGQSKWIDTFFY